VVQLKFRRAIDLLVCAGVMALVGAGLGAPLRLAIIAEEPALSTASDMLTAQLSGQSQIALVEREQLQKVFTEQALGVEEMLVRRFK
jgi:Curli production assembly/transport component CsgG